MSELVRVSEKTHKKLVELRNKEQVKSIDGVIRILLEKKELEEELKELREKLKKLEGEQGR